MPNGTSGNPDLYADDLPGMIILDGQGILKTWTWVYWSMYQWEDSSLHLVDNTEKSRADHRSPILFCSISHPLPPNINVQAGTPTPGPSLPSCTQGGLFLDTLVFSSWHPSPNLYLRKSCSSFKLQLKCFLWWALLNSYILGYAFLPLTCHKGNYLMIVSSTRLWVACIWKLHRPVQYWITSTWHRVSG